jgi:endonuclease/exonuclease/phosphatase family metal-dependent hydrolase
MTLRIGSFNCENFFSRATLLNKDWPDSAAQLKAFAQLQTLLAKTSYTGGKTTIEKLMVDLEPFLLIRENRAKLGAYSGKKPNRKFKLVASGSADWDGSVELRRQKISAAAQENTIRVIREINADILCVVEMEDRPTLQAVGRHPLLGSGANTRRYVYDMLIDGNDDRGIDVGVLSRFPITTLESHIHDYNLKNGKPDLTSPIFSRDCLVARIEVGAKPLFLLCNHFKSQGYGSAKANNAKRSEQCSTIVQKILPTFDLTQEYVVVAGDFNADAHLTQPQVAKDAADSVQALAQVQGLHDVLHQSLQADAWTYVYQNRKQQLDYLLVSDALAARLVTVGVERRGMEKVAQYTNGAVQPFPEVTGATTAASDHAAVWAEFNL